jgi:hypothetical protein
MCAVAVATVQVLRGVLRLLQVVSKMVREGQGTYIKRTDQLCWHERPISAPRTGVCKRLAAGCGLKDRCEPTHDQTIL